MVEQLDNIPEVTQDADPVDIAKVEKFEGVGEITIGIGSNWYILATALCLADNPVVNKYLLAQKMRIVDRMTKTNIFPREGMSLPEGVKYSAPVENNEEK